MLCVLLQPEEPERGLHLCSGGSYRTCEGPGEKISQSPVYGDIVLILMFSIIISTDTDSLMGKVEHP